MKKYLETVKGINQQTNFKELYSRIFSGIFSSHIAALCIGSKITPNHLTLLMIPCGVIGGLSIIFGQPIYCALGSFLFIFLNILDAADGQLARYTNKSSSFGDYLDRVTHYITNSCYILSIGIFLYLNTNNTTYIYVMFICELCIVGDEVMRDLLFTCGISKLNDTSPGMRKKEKSKTRLVINQKLSLIFHIFFSNVAFFHLNSLCLIYFCFFYKTYPIEIYYILFTLVIIIKTFLRAYSLRKFIP